MRKLFFLFFILSFTFSSCSSTEDSEDLKKEGDVYFKVSVVPGLNGVDIFVFKSKTAIIEVETGTSFQTDPFTYSNNENLPFEVLVSSSNKCYTVTVESFFNNVSFDKKVFEMGRITAQSSSSLCKDGLEKSVIITTPK